MEKFAIIPDSSCDMITTLRERFNVQGVIRGTIYNPDGTQSLADVDYENISPEEYYNSMKGRNVLYKTATPPVSEIIDVFEPFLKAGVDILTISLSSALSGSYQQCCTVAKDLMEKYPERKIICVDSLRYASASALLTVKACEKRDSGATIEETAEYLENLRHCIHQMGSLDDLFFCVKTGRVSNFKALMGTLIGVNTMADFAPEGLSSVVGKTKGHRNALDLIVRYVKKSIVNPEEQIIFVSHSNREESAKILAERIRNELKPKDVIITPVGMSCGASIGPGLCSAYYIGEPVSADNVAEKKLFAQCTNEQRQK